MFWTLHSGKIKCLNNAKNIMHYFVCCLLNISLFSPLILIVDCNSLGTFQYPVHCKHYKTTVTIRSMFSPLVLGCRPMAHRRQSTSWMVLIFSSSFFFSGSLVTIVTSSPCSVLRTDFTWEFFHKSTPEFCSSLVQFALMKLSKFLKTYRQKLRCVLVT